MRWLDEYWFVWMPIVTTPSAKADGFLGHARTIVPRFVPNAQSKRTSKDITGGVDITVNDQPAGRAGVNTVSKRFRNIRQTPAAGAYLRSPVGVNLNQLPTSFLHFVGELGKERTPACITDRLSQHTSGQRFDIQILDGDKAVVIGNLPAKFMLEIRTLVTDAGVGLLEQPDGLSPAGAAFLTLGDLPLTPAQLPQSRFEVTGISHQLSIGEGGEGTKPHIDTYSLRRRQGGTNIDNYTEAGVPLPGFMLQGKGLNLTGNRAVHLQSDDADSLGFKPASVRQVAAVSPGGKSIAVKSIPGLETRISRFLPCLHPAEESPEGLVNPPEHILAGGVVGQFKVTRVSYLLELVRLVVVVKAQFLHSPRLAAFLESGIIQRASLIKLMLKSFCLLSVWVKAILKSPTQKLSHPFTDFATRYNDKAGIGRLHSYYTTGKEVGQFLCQLKQAVPLP